MINETEEVAFAMWTAETANASREEWNKAEQDKWIRMARAAILTLEGLRL